MAELGAERTTCLGVCKLHDLDVPWSRQAKSMFSSRHFTCRLREHDRHRVIGPECARTRGTLARAVRYEVLHAHIAKDVAAQLESRVAQV